MMLDDAPRAAYRAAQRASERECAAFGGDMLPWGPIFRSVTRMAQPHAPERTN
jgi:hypothetical protein